RLDDESHLNDAVNYILSAGRAWREVSGYGPGDSGGRRHHGPPQVEFEIQEARSYFKAPAASQLLFDHP
ncbi:hypothetical protein BFJ63_vAg20501, partial [Fusarium oxysporum f. sp. narcissi]